MADRNLTPEEVPIDAADWCQFVRFARTLDQTDRFDDAAALANIARSSNLSDRKYSLLELRICVFFEYRRWNHFGHPRTESDIAYHNLLIAEIRKEIS